jgi:hypothetical protein
MAEYGPEVMRIFELVAKKLESKLRAAKSKHPSGGASQTAPPTDPTLPADGAPRKRVTPFSLKPKEPRKPPEAARAYVLQNDLGICVGFEASKRPGDGHIFRMIYHLGEDATLRITHEGGTGALRRVEAVVQCALAADKQPYLVWRNGDILAELVVAGLNALAESPGPLPPTPTRMMLLLYETAKSCAAQHAANKELEE